MLTYSQTKHQWLDQFIGQWVSETKCKMTPDQPPIKTTGTESVRSLGEFWIIAEGEGEMPCGSTGKTILTLGYDPRTQHYVGTFLASMMSHLWLYQGVLESNLLILNTEGPNFTNSAVVKYRDTLEFVDGDHRKMTSQVLGDDGDWHQFMTTHYWRKS